MVTAATIYLSLLGPKGLEQVALTSQNQTAKLLARLCEIEGVEQTFSGNIFHEAVVTLDRPVAPVLEALADRNILGGLDLSLTYPDLGNSMLICATETKTDADLQHYADELASLLSK